MIDATELEAQKRALLSRIDGWSVAKLSYRPAPDAWSALQVLDHLVRTEEEILSRAKQGSVSPHRIGLRDRIGFFAVRRIFQTDKKVKAPASAPQVLPDQDPSLSAILDRWQTTRSDFAQFQRELSRKQARSGLFRHPVCGWMGAPQITEFFYVHMIHHDFQLRRLGSAGSASPGSQVRANVPLVEASSPTEGGSSEPGETTTEVATL